MHSEYPHLAFGILLALLCVQCCGVLYLLKLYQRDVQFFKIALTAEGVVVGSWRYASGDGPNYFAEIHYTVGTTEHSLKGGIWTGYRRYKRGDRVPVRYLSQTPEQGRIEKKWETRFLLGGAIMLLGPISLITVLLAKELLP